MPTGTVTGQNFGKDVEQWQKWWTVHRSIEECLSPSPSEEVAKLVPTAGPASLPTIDKGRLAEYERCYGRKLKALEAAIVDSWRTEVGMQESVYTYPGIPQHKLANAKASYAIIGPDELILGLQDSMAFGSAKEPWSAKEGALFTTTRIFWKSIGTSSGASVAYKDINPGSITFKSSFFNKHLILSKKQRLRLSGITDERPLISLSSFVSDVALFWRC
jgi:hypothetical protein